jgi:hypothetical protein
MGRLNNIDIEIVVEENGTTNGGHANGFAPNAEEIDGLGNQAVGDSMVTARTKMEGDIGQTFWPLESLSREDQTFRLLRFCFHNLSAHPV